VCGKNPIEQLQHTASLNFATSILKLYSGATPQYHTITAFLYCMGVDTGVKWGIDPPHDLFYIYITLFINLYILPIIEKIK